MACMGRSEDVEDALSRMKRDFLPHSIAQQIASNAPSARGAGEVVLSVAPDQDSGHDSGEDSLLWDSWSKATGGTQSWRRRRRDGGAGADTSISSLGSDSSSDAQWVAGACALIGANHQEGTNEERTRVAVASDAQEVVEYARFLGIDPLREPHLLAIAQEGLVAPLPDGWTEFEDAEGNLYYHQASSDESVWTHPLDAFYRSKVQGERARARERRQAQQAARASGASKQTSKHSKHSSRARKGPPQDLNRTASGGGGGGAASGRMGPPRDLDRPASGGMSNSSNGPPREPDRPASGLMGPPQAKGAPESASGARTEAGLSVSGALEASGARTRS